MSDPVVDLRSDTVTRPTGAMREAMARAEVGDDVFAEDPTVRRLEEEAASRTGKEAALFVPTGTMGNQIAVHLLARRGTEVLLEEGSHVYNYELGAMAAWSGALPRVLRGERGFFEPDAVERAVWPPNYYFSRASLMVLENSHNTPGGPSFGPTFRPNTTGSSNGTTPIFSGVSSKATSIVPSRAPWKIPVLPVALSSAASKRKRPSRRAPINSATVSRAPPSVGFLSVSAPVTDILFALLDDGTARADVSAGGADVAEQARERRDEQTRVHEALAPSRPSDVIQSSERNVERGSRAYRRQHAQGEARAEFDAAPRHNLSKSA